MHGILQQMFIDVLVPFPVAVANMLTKANGEEGVALVHSSRLPPVIAGKSEQWGLEATSHIHSQELTQRENLCVFSLLSPFHAAQDPSHEMI